MNRKLAVILIVLLITSCSFQPRFLQTHWSLGCQNINEGWFGLSDVSIYNDLVIADGHIWAASSGGLLRYDNDGKGLVQFLSPICPIGSNYIAGLSHYNGKLIISDAIGVSVYDYENDSWIEYVRYEDYGLEFPLIQASKIINNQVWISAVGGILIFTEEENWQVLYAESQYENTEIWDFYQDQNGVLHLYAVDANQKMQRNETSIHLIWESGRWEENAKAYEEIISGPNKYSFKNDIFYGGVFISEDNGETWDEFINESPYTKLLHISDDGEIFVGTLDGIIKYDINLLEIGLYHYPSIGPRLSSVESVVCNNNDICAIVALDGWSLFDSSQLVHKSNMQLKDVQITENRIYYLLNQPINQALHFISTNQLTNYDEYVTFSEPIGSYAATDSYVLVVTDNYDGYLIDNNKKELVFSLSDYYKESISEIKIIKSETDSSVLLIINDLMISRFNGQSLVKIEYDPQITLGPFSEQQRLAFVGNELIIIDEQFELDIINFEDGSIESLKLDSDFEMQTIRDIAIDQERNIYFAEKDFLVRFDWKAWECISEDELGLEGIFNLYIDPNGNVWAFNSAEISMNKTGLNFHSCEN